MITISSNAEQVAKDLRDYIQETGVTDGQGVQMVSKAVTRTLLQMTPPIKSLSPSESFGIQRQVGDMAVQRDLRRSFKPLEDLRVRTSPKNKVIMNKVQKALDRHDSSLIATLLTNMRYPNITADRIVEEATPALHDSLRKQGRVPARTVGFFVFNKSSFTKLLDAELEAVGRAKAGWLGAALVLGLTAPTWIARHGAPGTAQDMTLRPVNPTFSARNGVLYLYNFAEETRLVDLALMREAASLERQLVAKRRGLWDKKR